MGEAITLMRGGVRSGSCELFAAARLPRRSGMEHVGAGVALRGAYNAVSGSNVCGHEARIRRDSVARRVR